MNTNPHYLITGASGLLGRALMHCFPTEHTIGLAFSRANHPLEKLDLTDHEAVTHYLQEKKPKVIIHAAAERRPNVASDNPEHVMNLNVATTRNLARNAEEIGAHIIYISTDYVFDGTQPPYKPEDQPNPLNFYGKTKLAGELAIQEVTNNYTILRVPILYGQVEHIEESAVTALLPLLKQSDTSVDNWAIRYPMLTDDAATICFKLAQMVQHGAVPKGIFHCSGPDKLTKYQMLKIMAEAMSTSFGHIQPANEPSKTGAIRPKNCQLDTSQLTELGIIAQTDFATGIEQLVKMNNLKL